MSSHRARLERALAIAGLAIPVALALLALTRYRGDWTTQRFLLVYMAPMFAFGAAWALRRLRALDATPPRALALDVAAFALGAIRVGGGWGVLPWSGHMLFLTYVACSDDSRRFRWSAIALVVMTSWFKLGIWDDWRSWAFGAAFGVALASLRARPRAVVVRTLAVGFALALFFPPLYGLTITEERGPELSLPTVPDGVYRVFVADWGYHTAIVVEQPRGWTLGPPGEEGAPFVEYAWGDRRFFMESDYWPHAVFATLVLPTVSVLYLDGRPDPPALGGARAVYARTVDAPTLQRLLRELERSFGRAPGGPRLAPHPVVAGYRGRFHPSFGRYLWTRNCNWWTVERLSAASLADGSTGVVFSGQVADRLLGFTRLRS